MLIAKGSNVRIVLEDGNIRRGPSLLHDESGEDWPYASGLITGFVKTQRPCDDKIARRYFGGDYEIRTGRIELPPRDLSQWREVGLVKEAFYTRRGDHEGPYRHEFGERRLFGIFRLPGRGRLPVLYERGSAMRLELGPRAHWDWHGIVSP